jgi:hypothetical protein
MADDHDVDGNGLAGLKNPPETSTVYFLKGFAAIRVARCKSI